MGKALFEQYITGITSKFTYKFEALVEHLPIEPHFDDKETVRHIANEYYNKCNNAAWFCACVTASYEGIEKKTYLGCCSYNSFEEFMKDDYFHDMIEESRENLLKELKRLKKVLNEINLGK